MLKNQPSRSTGSNNRSQTQSETNCHLGVCDKNKTASVEWLSTTLLKSIVPLLQSFIYFQVSASTLQCSSAFYNFLFEKLSFFILIADVA